VGALQYVDKVIDIDQAPIGRTPPVQSRHLYGLFNDIRDLFAETQDAKMRVQVSRFSFNVRVAVASRAGDGPC
jgi:excinuclease ABC subunit A